MCVISEFTKDLFLLSKVFYIVDLGAFRKIILKCFLCLLFAEAIQKYIQIRTFYCNDLVTTEE